MNNEQEIKNKKIYEGIVVSDKMNKTIVAKIKVYSRANKIGKFVAKLKKYKVHDENSEAKIGDKIEFYLGRKISKTKYMYLKRVL